MTTQSDSTPIAAHSNGAGEFLTPGKFGHFEVHALGVKFKKDIPEEEWLEATRKSIAMFEGSRDLHLRAMFAVGDCLNFGEGVFGERYAQAIDDTRKTIRLSMKTLQNVGWVAGSVEMKARHEMLSFAHHEAVAKLESVKEQIEFLDAAEESEWTAAELKKQVKEKHPSKKGAKPKAGAKTILDFSDPKDCLKALEKVSEYLTPKTVEAMEEEGRRQFSGTILAVVECFAECRHEKLYERLATLVANYLEATHEELPIPSWPAAKKKAWHPALHALEKKGKRLTASMEAE